MRRRARKARSVRAVGYVRFSTEHQGDNSVGRQSAALDAWATRTGHELVAVYFDLAVSRTVDHGERPGLMAALAALEPGSVLVAQDVTRFAGDGYILEGIRREARRRSARATTSDETGDADLDEDRQDFEVMFSKREIKNIHKRTLGAMAVKRLKGEVLGREPFGMRRKADGQHVVRRGRRACVDTCAGCLHLEPNPTEQGVIARAKLLSDRGLSVRAIASQLAIEGIVGRTGHPLSHTQVHRFLSPLVLADNAA